MPSLLLAMIAAQAADALSYAYGVATFDPVEVSIVHHLFGPGPTLLIKAGLMVLLVLAYRRYRWRWWLWKAAAVFAIAIGVAGAALNTAVIMEMR
jgi:hypothetical protein